MTAKPTSEPTRLPGFFLVAEVLLVLLVPVLAFVGVQSLLDSTEGNYVEQVGPNDPGWRAPVEASPVHAVVISDQGRLAAVAVITQPGSDANGGAAVSSPP